LDIVEGSAPSETEKPTSNISVRWAGNVGPPATQDNFSPTAEKETLWIMMMHLDWLEPHKGVARDEWL
jgi:hypothetical protein